MNDITTRIYFESSSSRDVFVFRSATDAIIPEYNFDP